MGNCALPPAWCSWASRNGCTTNGRGGNTAAGREEEHVSKAPTLPLDILLEILARADAVTLVRCAAASMYLRRHIADPAFLHRYHADAGCVPSLLLGMFQQHGKHQPCRFVSMSPSTKLTLQLTPPTAASDDFFASCVPVTSRAGLVLLRRVHDRNLIELCVYSPVTGRYSFLPPATLYEYNNSHVLLPGDEDDNTGHSFRLLVVDKTCRTQIFSSRTGSWGSITETSGALPPGTYHRVQPAAVVLRGVAHWLCHHQSSGRYGVLAIRIADGQAAVIGEVPESCLGRRRRNIVRIGLCSRAVPKTRIKLSSPRSRNVLAGQRDPSQCTDSGSVPSRVESSSQSLF